MQIRSKEGAVFLLIFPSLSHTRTEEMRARHMSLAYINLQKGYYQVASHQILTKVATSKRVSHILRDAQEG